MPDFSTEDLIIKSRERIAYGYISMDVVYGDTPEGGRLPWLGQTIWPFDAEMRGYDMALFKQPYAGYGHYA